DGAIGDAAVNLFGEQHRRLGGPGRVEATGAAQGVGQHRPVAQFCDQLGVLEEVAGGSVAHGDDSSVAGGDVLAGPGADPVAGDDEVGGAGGAVGQLHLGAARGAGPAQVSVAHRDHLGAVAQVDGRGKLGQQAELDLGTQDREVPLEAVPDQAGDVDAAG